MLSVVNVNVPNSFQRVIDGPYGQNPFSFQNSLLGTFVCQLVRFQKLVPTNHTILAASLQPQLIAQQILWAVLAYAHLPQGEAMESGARATSNAIVRMKIAQLK